MCQWNLVHSVVKSEVLAVEAVSDGTGMGKTIGTVIDGNRDWVLV